MVTILENGGHLGLCHNEFRNVIHLGLYVAHLVLCHNQLSNGIHFG